MRGETTADTSVVVPALASWHTAHEAAAAATEGITRLPSHVVLEAVSVLTRLPGGLSLSAADAVETVTTAFPGSPWLLTPAAHNRLVTIVGRVGLPGGQVYDALVGMVAVHHGLELLTLDRRAEPAYRAVGATASTVA
jgi:predicted nucleic acid-binding protein